GAHGSVAKTLPDMLGWDELVDAVARVYRSLTPDEQQQVALWGRDYGVAGAIDYFGGRYGRPKALLGGQNYYLWGPGDRSGAVMLAIGFRESDLRPWFDSVEQAAEVTCEYCMPDRQLQR